MNPMNPIPVARVPRITCRKGLCHSLHIICRLCGTAIILACSTLSTLVTFGAPSDLAALFSGVSEIAAPGIPGPLCVFGDQAFVVITGSSPQAEPVVAATLYGSGRVVAFGHDGYFTPGSRPTSVGQTSRFFENAIRWAAGSKASPRVAVIQEPEVQTVLASAGISSQSLRITELTRADVLVIRYSMADEASIDAVRQFLVQGGGLLIAQPVGWGWKQLNPFLDLARDHPGNRLLAAAGIVWTDGYLSKTSANGFAVGGTPVEFSHSAAALSAAEEAAAGRRSLSTADRAQISRILEHALIALSPSDQILLPKLNSFIGDRVVVPSPRTPINLSNIAARLSVARFSQAYKRDLATARQPHPAASLFPGSVTLPATDTPTLVTVAAKRTGWVSTGLYAAPGALIIATVPAAVVEKGYSLRVGAQSDQLWGLDSWERMPDITLSTPITSGSTQTANPFGGLVYLEMPYGGSQLSFDVMIAGAVQAPYFMLGQTDATAWKNTIRNRPGPWAELEGKNIIVTVPSDNIRNLDDVAGILTLWDRIVGLQDQLAGAPNPRTSPERIIPDQQISVGYMHAGYPIMTHLDVASNLVSASALQNRNIESNWGLFHEVGHNHQSPDWTFDGTVEVTVNIFTLYVQEKLWGVSPNDGWYVNEAARKRYIAGYDFKNPNFEQWKRDPFLALCSYTQLILAFGWDPFQRVFAEYLALPESQRPKTDQERRDQWLIRFSRTVGRNLGPFFEAWGIPTSVSARGSIANMPTWVPAELSASLPAIISLSRSQLNFSFQVGGSTPLSQSVTVSNAGGGSLTYAATSSVPWLTVSPASGTAPSTVSISLNPAALSVGTFFGTVTISGPGAAFQAISVTLNVLPGANAPSITSIVNGASFQVGFSPSAWVTIQGANLSRTARTWRGDEIVEGRLPTSLDGIRVNINGRAAFVYYISPTQLNVQAPADDDGLPDRPVEVEVVTPDGSMRTTAVMKRVAPGLFTITGRYAAAIHPDGTLVGPEGMIPGTASHPARPGDVVLLYTTGLGATDPSVPPGRVVTAPATLRDAVVVTVGGAQAGVSYAGLVGAGLYQINLVVPEVADGDQAAVVQVGGVQSQNGVLLTVRR